MDTKPLQYVLAERKATVGAHKGQIVQQAIPTGRQRVSFRALAEEAAHNTTLSQHEVMMALNELTTIAKRHVENGDIVELGDLGTISPSFRSKAIPKGETFRAQEHIYAPRAVFRSNRKYFDIQNRSYERTESPTKGKKGKGSTKPSPQPPSGGGSHSSDQGL